MARKLFISFLGTGFYRECTYYYEKGGYTPTKYIQQATLEQIEAAKWDKSDAVRFFITDKAYDDNWDSAKTTRFDGIAKQEVPYKRLEQTIQEMHLTADVKPVLHVPIGNGEDEMWRIFQMVFEEIQEGDELYIDLTHAFRYLPMLVLVLSNYSKFLKHITVKHLSYGNYEARDSDNRAPIVNLLPLTMLQDWTTAASEFLRHGYAERLKDLIREKLKPLLKDSKLRTENVKNVNQLATSLESFVEERVTCRGIDIANGVAAENLRKQLDKIEDTGVATLNPIFHKLKAAAKVPKSIPARCYDAAEWCFKRQQYQQAITILQEGINTFFCLRNGINIADEVRRDYVGRAFNIKYNSLTSENNKISDVNVVDNAVLSALLNDKLLSSQEVVYHYVVLSGTRNDFNHSGFRSRRKPLKPKQIKDKIKESLDFFKTILTDEDVEIRKPKLFINLSNHPSDKWGEDQLSAARQYGEVTDMPFPNIPPELSGEDIEKMAEETKSKIVSLYPDADITVHIVGEPMFIYKLVPLLKSVGIRCVSSTTYHDTKDLGDGKKLTVFHFVRFREY